MSCTKTDLSVAAILMFMKPFVFSPVFPITNTLIIIIILYLFKFEKHDTINAILKTRSFNVNLVNHNLSVAYIPLQQIVIVTSDERSFCPVVSFYVND